MRPAPAGSARAGVKRAVMRRTLCNVHERFLNCLRKSKFRKPLGGVQIVFTALIDHPNIPIFGGIVVRDHAVNLVQFQRRWIAGVFHAHREMRQYCRFFLHSVSLAIPYYVSCTRSSFPLIPTLRQTGLSRNSALNRGRNRVGVAHRVLIENDVAE